MKELALLHTLTPEIFTTVNALDKIIDDIKSRVSTFNSSIDTPKGRDEIKSFAFQIARVKTGIDNLGKERSAEEKRKAKLVDNERARVWDALESFQNQVRKPLTDWEEAEKARIAEIRQRIGILSGYADIVYYGQANSDYLKAGMDDLAAINTGEDFDEFSEEATRIKETSIKTLESAIKAAEIREVEALELANLRKEAQEREAKEKEEVARREAAERALKEAKEAQERALAATAAREAELKREAEHKELQLKFEAEKAQRGKLEAEKLVAQAAERERMRIEAEQARINQEAARREADEQHKDIIHKEIYGGLRNAGIDELLALSILGFIVSEEIPHLKIIY